MFREPGFLFGVTVARPKVYLKNQDGSASDVLLGALEWLPAIMRDDPWSSLKQFAETDGPFSVVTDGDGYWLDLKDLFVYGDQFINYPVSGVTNGNLVALPSAGLNVCYPSAADADGLFVASEQNTVAQDGVVQLSVLGALTDTTPNYRRIE